MKEPKVNSEGAKALDQAQKQFDVQAESIKELTLDRMNQAPKLEVEPQTKMSQKDIEKTNDIYLKPTKSIGSQEKFNEKYREDYEFARQYVKFIAENHECIGDDIEMWTKKFAGVPAEFWKVPTNKPIWAPRYVAEQIKGCRYHRLKTQESVITQNAGIGQFYGGMVVDTTVQRLDALPVSTRKSVFMAAEGF